MWLLWLLHTQGEVVDLVDESPQKSSDHVLEPGANPDEV